MTGFQPELAEMGQRQRRDIFRATGAPDAGMSAREIVAPGGAGEVTSTKKGRARYPKHLREAWNPNEE